MPEFPAAHSPKKLIKNKMTIVKYVLIAVALCSVAAATAFAVFIYGNLQKITVHPNGVTPSPIASVKPYIDAFNQLEPYSIALLGYGGGTHEGGKLSDTILIVHIVPKDKHIFLISVPRDLWVPLPVQEDKMSYWKINAAYAIGSDYKGYPNKPLQYTGEAGGGEMAKYALQLVTGVPIDHFASLDFSGFRKSIDVLGGVDVKVDRTFDDDLYPIDGKEADTCGKSPEEVQQVAATMSASKIESNHIFPCRYEVLHFDKGITHMDGATALKYVRSRHSLQDGGDFNRAARQRNLVLAVKKKVLSLDFFPKVIPFISSLSADLQTDLNLNDMEEFLKYKDDLSTYQISSIALTDQNVLVETRVSGQDALLPKAGLDQWDSLHQFILDQMASQSAQATSSATSSGQLK